MLRRRAARRVLVVSGSLAAAVAAIGGGCGRPDEGPPPDRGRARVADGGGSDGGGATTARVPLGMGLDQELVVRVVAEDSIAAQSGVRAGDRIVSFLGREVRSPRDVQLLYQQALPGPAPMEVLRDGARTALLLERRYPSRMPVIHWSGPTV